ncbi:hypothetical protein F5Y19DRAFT_480359 [Xylariaceae sp. FL1651]|nr:hypothetical protein F5Y19DRAFT_480359 [Xylariaceae sp. FL1651]
MPMAILPRIAIIGARPSGLVLASISHHNNITYTIFKRDSNSTAHEQGGTLDIHPHSGQEALHAAGLLDKFRTVVQPGADSIRIIKKDGTVLFESSGEHEETSAKEN